MKVLFVCLGNICRSVSAEAVFTHLVKNAELSDQIQCDSAGTAGYHAGEPADTRMVLHARKRGYKITSISRQIILDDFNKFDFIIGMDDSNVADLKEIAPNQDAMNKISKITDYGTDFNTSVPDPYYGGADSFELVLDILENSCIGLLAMLKEKLRA